MKKAIFTLLAAISATMNLSAQEKMIVEKTDGTKTEYNVDEVSRVYFTAPETPSDPGTSDSGNTNSEAVDLGLSVKWASCNVGASSPEEYGGYYAWGETEEKSEYSLNTYLHWDDKNGNGEFDWDEGTIKTDIAGTQYDVAHVKLGGSWRMPKKSECEELLEKCSWEWTTVNGVNGHKVTGPNGNSIFIPAAGNFIRKGNGGTTVYGDGYACIYWSSTPLEEKFTYIAYHMYADYLNEFGMVDSNRYDGRSVRPVSD